MTNKQPESLSEALEQLNDIGSKLWSTIKQEIINDYRNLKIWIRKNIY